MKKKNEKAKYELIRLISLSTLAWTSHLPVGICYCFKVANNQKNSRGEMQQLQMNPP